MNKKAEEIKTSDLFRQYMAEGKTPEQAAEAILDVITNGLSAAWSSDMMERMKKKVIDKWMSGKTHQDPEDPTKTWTAFDYKTPTAKSVKKIKISKKEWLLLSKKAADEITNVPPETEELQGVPPEVNRVAKELGWTITITKGGAVEFRHPGRMTPFYLIKKTLAAWQSAVDTMKSEAAQSNNRQLASELAKTAEIVRGEWLRSARADGSSYRHDIVKINGIEVGRIQYRKGGKRNDPSTTCFQNSCILGVDIEWLITQALSQGVLKVPGAMPIGE